MKWMFPVALIAAFIAALGLLTGVANAGNNPDPRLDAAASYVAGKPVTVWCEESITDWVQWGQSAGQNFDFMEGFTYPTIPGYSTIYLSPRVCLTLHALLDQGAENVGAYWGSLAVHTLVHESVHLLTGSADEHYVDCMALTKDADVAEQFFSWPTTETIYNTVVVRKKHRIVAVKSVGTNVTSPLLTAFNSFDQGWHDAAPAPYSGPC